MCINDNFISADVIKKTDTQNITVVNKDTHQVNDRNDISQNSQYKTTEKQSYIKYSDKNKITNDKTVNELTYSHKSVNDKKYGQQKINGHWYLYNEEGIMQTGFQYIKDQDKTVYYNEAGQMQYGQQKINGHWYLFSTTNGAMQTGFQYIKDQDKTVYYNKVGQMQYGQQKINGQWYLFSTTNGTMQTGFQYIKDQDKTVYYNEDGQMQYGQQKINGQWYLFSTTNGNMQTGFQYIKDQDKTVYYNEAGQMQYGKQKINNKYYLFNQFNGKMMTGWILLNGVQYYCYSDGHMAIDEIIDGKKLDINGKYIAVKLFVISGHGAGDPGACANGYREADLTRLLAKQIKQLGGNRVLISEYDRDYYQDNGITKLKLPITTSIIELHLDSASPTARGGHIIKQKGTKATESDIKLEKLITKYLPGRSKKIVYRDNLANPKRAMKQGYDYRLMECGFITNKKDVKEFHEYLSELAKGILEAFGV